MSEDNNVGKVGKSLREKRFAEKYRHTKNSRKNYEGEMWNSGDRQFIAFKKDRHTAPDRRSGYHQISLHFFGYYYDSWTMRKENKLSEDFVGTPIRPKNAAPLREFLVSKPANETFILPSFRGDYHLSFEKRSFLGGTELRWQFFNHKSEWEDARSLPFSERKRAIKGLKMEEERQKLWFAADQSDKLVAYLDTVLPYSFVP